MRDAINKSLEGQLSFHRVLFNGAVILIERIAAADQTDGIELSGRDQLFRVDGFLCREQCRRCLTGR